MNATRTTRPALLAPAGDLSVDCPRSAGKSGRQHTEPTHAAEDPLARPSDTVLALAFLAATAASVASSSLLIRSIERLARRWGMTDALLGLMAALAADAPEITSAVTALLHHRGDVGLGVTLGSNVFNLAALLGLGALVARGVRFHRRVVLLEGAFALWIAASTIAVVTGAIPPALGLLAGGAAALPYISLSAASAPRRRQIPLPRRVRVWLLRAVEEEEIEIHPALEGKRGGMADGVVAIVTLVLVVVANVVMVDAATTAGSRWGVPDIVTGALVLAAVTSLPNLVAAIYLSRRQRGSALLSEAMNSNAINVLAGLFLPAALIGMSRPTAPGALTAAAYAGLTCLVLIIAFSVRGLRPRHGSLVLVLYGLFVLAIAFS